MYATAVPTCVLQQCPHVCYTRPPVCYSSAHMYATIVSTRVLQQYPLQQSSGTPQSGRSAASSSFSSRQRRVVPTQIFVAAMLQGGNGRSAFSKCRSMQEVQAHAGQSIVWRPGLAPHRPHTYATAAPTCVLQQVPRCPAARNEDTREEVSWHELLCTIPERLACLCNNSSKRKGHVEIP